MIQSMSFEASTGYDLQQNINRFFEFRRITKEDIVSFNYQVSPLPYRDSDGNINIIYSAMLVYYDREKKK